MADLGNLLGALMCGLLQARRMADEQTAALAEHYRSNPLLEGLTVPRIRIPEVRMDIPMLIEDEKAAEKGEMTDPRKIAEALGLQLNESLARLKLKSSSSLQKAFTEEIHGKLDVFRQSQLPVMKETVAREVQAAFAAAVTRTGTKNENDFSAADRDIIATDLRSKAAAISMQRPAVAASILANIKTADVKERSNPNSVMRINVTFKEEGLEWTTQVNQAGGVSHTLQTE